MGTDKAADDWDRMKTNKFALNKIPHWNETDSLFSHSLFVSDCIIMNCDVMESMDVNNRYKRDRTSTNDWAITIQFITIVRTFVDLPDLLCVCVRMHWNCYNWIQHRSIHIRLFFHTNTLELFCSHCLCFQRIPFIHTRNGPTVRLIQWSALIIFFMRLWNVVERH